MTNSDTSGMADTPNVRRLDSATVNARLAAGEKLTEILPPGVWQLDEPIKIPADYTP